MTGDAFIHAHAVYHGGVMVSQLSELFINLDRLGSNDEQRILLIALEEKLNHLRVGVLIYYGIEGNIKSEQKSCCSQEYHVGKKNIVPRVDTFLF